jgi:hypothetical protein
MPYGVAEALPSPCAPRVPQNFRKRDSPLVDRGYRSAPSVILAVRTMRVAVSPTTEGQCMYHPTLSSPVTRRIWASPDAILLFFAGGAAEFAAIKAVDWLFFTGRLPSAPVERFFETVRFAQSVFFGDPAGAPKAVARINRIHRHVEDARGEEIPQWAYRDMPIGTCCSS